MNTLGVHYTQSELADYMASRLDIGPYEYPRVLDPACGGGALLSAVHRCHGSHVRLTGVDIRPEALTETAECVPAHTHCLDFLRNVGQFERRSFDAVIMNPPFLGGMKISTVHGADYLQFLQGLHPWAKGPVDLAAHFLLAAGRCVRVGGTLGIIATNTLAQGATRRAGLAHMLDHGWEIYEAQRSVPWPGEAHVKVCTVHMRRLA